MIFSAEHEALIATFMSQPPEDIKWTATEIEDLKRFIKDELMELQSNVCAYCQGYIADSHRMTIDIEHVLPKSKEDFYKYILANENLAISCRRCNFNPFKGAKIDFLTARITDENWKDPALYKFIHPRLESFEDHIVREEYQRGTMKTIHFEWTKEDAKAEYHFKYFGLEEIECDGFTNLEKDDSTTETTTDGSSVFDELQKEES